MCIYIDINVSFPIEFNIFFNGRLPSPASSERLATAVPNATESSSIGMGSCMSLNPEAREAKLKSDEIDRELQRSRRERQNVLKILLLGTDNEGN